MIKIINASVGEASEIKRLLNYVWIDTYKEFFSKETIKYITEESQTIDKLKLEIENKKLLNQDCDLRFRYTEMNLELAQIGNVLILGGTDEALKPFKDTNATFLVDSILEFREFLIKNNAVIIRDLKEVPTGRNIT